MRNRFFFISLVGLLICGLTAMADQKRGIKGIKRFHGHRQDLGRYAVVIGISKYKNKEVTSLKYAVPDAKAFYDFIRTPIGGGFKKENIKLLLDEDATVQNVRSALGTFLKKAVKNDFVYIYFAGHGAPEPKNPSNLYFLTYEADVNDLFGTTLPMDQITYILKKHIFAERVVVLTDACHSAGIGGSLGGTRAAGDNRINDFVRELAKTKPGRVVVTGSRTGEYSQEGKRWGGGHGVFTHYWLEALNGSGDVDGNGIVTLGEAFDYTSRKVAKDTKNNQHPDTLGNFDNDMPLAVHDPAKYEQMLKNEGKQVAALEKQVAQLEAKRKKVSSKQKKLAELTQKKADLQRRLAALKDETKRVNCSADMVRIDGLFCIDRYEYPNKAGGEPLVEVSFEEAQEMCAKAGKRMCTLGEWTRACKGDVDWPYPYGPKYNPGQCNDNRSGRKSKVRSAEFENCRSREGVYDLSGNVFEWALLGKDAAEQAIAGGSFDDSSGDVSCGSNDTSEAENNSEYVGFRCCR
jgi:uncharacterized caspase-like protein